MNTADDRAIAALRARAVEDYLRLKEVARESVAATETVRAWSRRHLQSVRTVSVGGFSPRTLRTWSSLYIRSGKDPKSLAPDRKGNSGRPAKQGRTIEVASNFVPLVLRARNADRIRMLQNLLSAASEAKQGTTR